jgi:hypothetical protein
MKSVKGASAAAKPQHPAAKQRNTKAVNLPPVIAAPSAAKPTTYKAPVDAHASPVAHPHLVMPSAQAQSSGATQ